MDHSLFLAKVFGLYLIGTGIAGPFRYRELMLLVERFVDNRPLVYVTSMFGFIVGVLLVASHNHWIADWPVVVTVLAWLVLLKGMVYLLMPFEVTSRLVRRVNRPAWYRVGGALSVLLGVFLAGKGFRLF